ncbi:MAG TPA: GNVR domain-containing protein [Gemmatimonadaceae bacterium]|nr:GNVR domain-containing protein [Gemmatimonadaceae bacterium]
MLAALLLATLAVVALPTVFRARASFAPNTTSSTVKLPPSISGMRGIGGLASQIGLGGATDPSQSPEFYAELIASRELRTRLLHSRFPDPRSTDPADSARLLDLLRIRTKDPERKLELGLRELSRTMRTTVDEETNIVKLMVDAEWRGIAAAMANRTLDFVSEFNREQRTSRAQSNRIFLDSRVSQVRADLLAAEARQRAFHEANRSWRSSPSLALQEQQLQREVDRAADLYLALQQQLENARLEEINDAAMITVVDSAVPPRKAEWPRYGLLLMSTLTAGFVIGAMAAGTATVMEDWRKRNPASASQLHASIADLRNAFRRRRRQPARARRTD